MDPEEFREFIKCKIVEDQYVKAGPLGGIHAGLQSATNNAIFVFAGDMPFLDIKIITHQIAEFNKGNHNVLMPKVGQFIEPLHAIYNNSILNDLERFIAR
jgi:molybdenum cofactor guanylyltransferase